MDNDALRHGKPTLHLAYDEATAVLAGDALHDFAFEVLSDPGLSGDPFVRIELVRALALASGMNGMAGGQMMDIAAETASFDLPTGDAAPAAENWGTAGGGGGNGRNHRPHSGGRAHASARLCP